MKRHATALILLFGLALTGCASAGPTSANDGGAGSSATSAPADSAPTPTPADSITVGVDALATVYDGEEATYPYSDPEPLLAFVEELTGAAPQSEDIEDPWGNGEVWGTKYTWDGIIVSSMTDGGAGIRVTAAEVNGVPVTTTPGIAVGSTSDAVVAAGGWETWNDGTSYYYGIDPHPVEGTQSLSTPGEVGHAYVDITTQNGVVTALTSPANDYSDI
ncbi:hypothetical protein [Microbacterium sp. NPDC058389]|uniref:hypothetical protein n=1 Tax=Microbacterium sp. NPDC058389 TaxID=3346475 RepID=UPI00365AA44D